MLIKTTLLSLASLSTLPAFAHVSQSSVHMHQTEHLLWLLALIPVAWAIRPIAHKWLKRVKSR
jgi:hypothetical protein